MLNGKPNKYILCIVSYVKSKFQKYKIELSFLYEVNITKTKIYKLEIVYEDIILLIKFNYENNRNLTERFEKVTKFNLGQFLLGGCRFYRGMFVLMAQFSMVLVLAYYEPWFCNESNGSFKQSTGMLISIPDFISVLKQFQRF